MCVPFLFNIHIYSVLSQYLAAAEQNSQLNFKGLCIYGLLTNFTQFIFTLIIHPPKNSVLMSRYYLLVNTKRMAAFSDMVDVWAYVHNNGSELTSFHLVSNKIFGIILTAYMDGLQAITCHWQYKAKENILLWNPSIANQLISRRLHWGWLSIVWTSLMSQLLAFQTLKQPKGCFPVQWLWIRIAHHTMACQCSFHSPCILFLRR